MGERQRQTIRVVSHGPSCLDGVVAAAAVNRFYRGHRVVTTLASNADADRTLQGIDPADELWITDLSWNTVETGQRLTDQARQGTAIYWIDHHRSAVRRAEAPEFRVPFARRILSERRSASLLVFDFLRRRSPGILAPEEQRAFEAFRPFALLADDHDRWIHRIAESSDWALAVQTLGGASALREILKLDQPRMSRRLRAALDEGRTAMARSVDLARNTLVERQLSGGLLLRTACCFGYSSEVGAALYTGAKSTVVALFDLRSQGVSLRRSPDCTVDLSALAVSFGGGGHAAAAGFSMAELERLTAERLADALSERLNGQYEANRP